MTPSVASSDGDGGRTGSAPLLRADSLHKHYGPVHAVRGVAFDLEGNTYVTLLGPSGCGKTTILRMIGGFESVSDGTLELDGASLIDVPPNKRPINTVFQNYALFPHMTVVENVGFGLAYSTADRATAERVTEKALDLVQMREMADRRPRQLSGGQQQRVALARAIVNEPQLLLLDEPLSALDRRMRKDMQIELKDLQRRLGMTFLHVTHDQEEAFALSDWIIVMNDGRIEQQGAPTEIYRRPANAYVADFIGGANRIGGRVVELADGHAVIDTPIGRFRAPCAETLGADQGAILCLRPEQLEVAADGAIEVAVTHVIFRGSDWLVEARARDDSILNFHAAGNDAPTIGDQVRIGFAASQAWVAADG